MERDDLTRDAPEIVDDPRGRAFVLYELPASVIDAECVQAAGRGITYAVAKLGPQARPRGGVFWYSCKPRPGASRFLLDLTTVDDENGIVSGFAGAHDVWIRYTGYPEITARTAAHEAYHVYRYTVAPDEAYSIQEPAAKQFAARFTIETRFPWMLKDPGS